MIQLTINGKAAEYDGDPEMPLLWYLRDGLELTGTKFGCGMGLCGACTVHINGEAARSCVTPMIGRGRQAHHDHRRPEPERRLIPSSEPGRPCNVPQCGYCQSGPDHAGRRPAEDQTKADGSRRSTPPCRATSAAAGHISAFGRPSSRQRG